MPAAAGILAEWNGGPAGLDLRRVVVVTPAARAGRRLGELLLEEAEARGLPLTPPRIVTIGRLPELLYQGDRPTADAVTARYAFAQALRSVDPGLLAAVFPSPPKKMSAWIALAGVVDALHRETGVEGLDFHAIGRAFRRGFPYDDSARWEVLGRVQDRYMEILRESGLGDLDRERRRALEEGRLTSPGEVWLVGVVELPRVVRRMLESLPSGVRALIHAPEALKERFDALGCVLAPEWENAHIPLDEGKIRVVQRPPGQADAVADILHGFGGRFAAEEVVVGVPDPELVPYLERGLAMAGIPHRFAGGTPLSATGPVALLQALAEYLEARSFPAFGALIRHPDLSGLLGAVHDADDVTGPLAIADRFQTEHLQASVQGPLPGVDKADAQMRHLVRRLEETLALDAFGGKRRISSWMPGILEVLVKVYGGEPLDLSHRRVRRLVEASTRIRDAAASLVALPRALDVEVEAAEAIAVLLADVRADLIPPDPQEEAVELLGWLELPLDDAPAVVLTGVNDRHIPEALGADPFLPGALRTHLGIPDDGARYARDAYLLNALVHSRESVHLVAGRSSAGGDPLRLSRLLFAAPDPEVARRVRRFLDDEGAEGGGGPGAGWEEGGVRRCGEPEESPPSPDPGPSLRPARSGFRAPPRDPLVIPEVPTRLRVTDFGSLLTDPYRWVLERVLNLRPLDDSAREMDGLSFGSLSHLVLERFGTSPEVASPDPEAVEKKLGRLLDTAVHEKYGRHPVPAVRVQTEQLRARLGRFARWQADWIAAGWRVACVEQQPDPGVEFDVDGETILLRGKIDRIDHNEETGGWAVFDYKTGDDGKDPETAHRKGRGQNRRWVDLQLPLYRLLLAGVLKEDGTPVVPEDRWAGVRLGYILLPRTLDGVGESLAEWTSDELAEAEETARDVVRALRRGEFRFDPWTRGFRADPFDTLLGRTLLPATREGEEGGEE